MGKSDECYRFTDHVELDEGFFSIELPQEKKEKTLKRERGSQKKAKVLLTVENSPSEEIPKKGRPAKRVGHLKM